MLSPHNEWLIGFYRIYVSDSNIMYRCALARDMFHQLWREKDFRYPYKCHFDMLNIEKAKLPWAKTTFVLTINKKCKTQKDDSTLFLCTNSKYLLKINDNPWVWTSQVSCVEQSKDVWSLYRYWAFQYGICGLLWMLTHITSSTKEKKPMTM